MIRELLGALHDYWNALLPAYLDGNVPDNVALPFIRYSAPIANLTGRSVGVAYIYTQGADANAQRADLVDRLYLALPYSGAKLTYDGGYCVLYRGDGDFITLTEDPGDRTVLAARINFEIHYYQGG